MEETKLTVRVPKRTLAAAKQYAAKNNTTLTRLITLYLEKLDRAQETQGEELSPVVLRLTGIASWEDEKGDYREVYRHYLQEKYLVKMRVLIDTNIVLDVIFNRKQFYAAAARVMTLAAEEDIEGYIAAHAVTTVYYLVAHHQGSETAKVALVDLLRISRVADVNQAVIDQALSMPYRDLEDAVTMMAAVHAELDYVVTRNPDDFRYGPLSVVSPVD